MRRFEDSPVGLFQLLDLSLQLEVVSTTCGHPTERDSREEGRYKYKKNIEYFCYDVGSSPLCLSNANNRVLRVFSHLILSSSEHPPFSSSAVCSCFVYQSVSHSIMVLSELNHD